MLQKQFLTQSWCFGLSDMEIELLRQALGDEHELTALTRKDLLNLSVRTASPPFIMWISSSVGERIKNLPEEIADFIALVPKVLVLRPSYTLEDFEQACDQGFSDFLRHPMSRERISDIMRKALESYALQHDMQCMTREILLERELLERKHDIMSFLVNFLSNSTESLELTGLLQNAFESMEQLIPMRSMHAVFWDLEQSVTPTVTMYISAPEGSPQHQAWRETLLEHSRKVLKLPIGCTQVNHLNLHSFGKTIIPSSPEDDAVISVPLFCGKEQLGLLLLSTTMEKHLGRDQAVALDSAMRAFAVSVKNALRFQLMQMYADYDALTKVHSRRHFETFIAKEMQRFARHGQTFSLVLLDIDHFKAVNDTYGHHVGDIVLKESGKIIAECIRNIDYCARYGGEEFAIILPYTEQKKAVHIAERIRTAFEKNLFHAGNGLNLQVTVSLGIATMKSGTDKNKQALLCEADSALYKAKQSGRNQTCISEVRTARAKVAAQ
ncbi:GGDEF domain-containing protein [Desulfovibrio sp. OttesenSCG-928-G15]|nr:GGDEF domain-containing protein [Desulfovibrio sp. OttesenSCG-928-G15]